MDSDEDFQEAGKPSTSSCKGPPPFKRPKPLSPAEKMKKSREGQSAEKKLEMTAKEKERFANMRVNQSPDKKEEAKAKNRERMAKKRLSQSPKKKEEVKAKNIESKANRRLSQSPKKKEEVKAKNTESMAKQRLNESPKKKEEVKAKNTASKANKRLSESPKNKEEVKAKNTASKANKRADKSPGERNEAKEQDNERKSRKRQNARTKVCFKEAQRTDEILDGSYVVKDLKDSDDNIGDMDTVCQYCSALKFKRETSSTCCGNGKVMLDPFPVPPPEINNLWHADNTKGRVFRENSRPINNAVCLSSIQANLKEDLTRMSSLKGKSNSLQAPYKQLRETSHALLNSMFMIPL